MEKVIPILRMIVLLPLIIGHKMKTSIEGLFSHYIAMEEVLTQRCNVYHKLCNEICEAIIDTSLHWTGKDEERLPQLKKLRTIAKYTKEELEKIDDTSINGVPLGEIYAQIERQLIYERAVKDIGYVL